MKVINARNVNDALTKGLDLISSEGQVIPSRAGETLEVPYPVSTVYHKPNEKVLVSQCRDANPFFHLFESLWIIVGRQDVKFLTEFNKRMAEYSDDGEVFNAPYGHRLRYTFGKDQIKAVIEILRKDPTSRQAVMQIWDPADLTKQTKDKACNMQAVFRVRNGELHLTIYNRSNDMIWGAYGANVVQFSTLLEYVAACVDLPVGTYTQVSNSFHVYTEGAGGDVFNRVSNGYENITINPYEHLLGLVTITPDDVVALEHDLDRFFYIYDNFEGIEEAGECRNWSSKYFNELVMPMLCVYLIYKHNGKESALRYTDTIKADDWRMACEDWLNNRKGAK